VLFADESSCGRDGIINIYNQHRWAEENIHDVILSKHQQQFSINVRAGITADFLVGPHVLQHRLTSSYYKPLLWKMYS
jgi:hypothetical protein